MCGGCDTGIGNCTGSIAYILEKLASFIAMTAVILCIVITVTISLGLGIGLGYNYCFVDLKVLTDVDVNHSDTTITTITTTTTPDPKNPDEPESPTDPENLGRRRRLSTRPRILLPMPLNKHTIAIPLNADFDFSSLISKLRSRNKNVTLELIT